MPDVNVKGAFNQEEALEGAFSVTVKSFANLRLKLQGSAVCIIIHNLHVLGCIACLVAVICKEHPLCIHKFVVNDQMIRHHNLDSVLPKTQQIFRPQNGNLSKYHDNW